MGVPRGAAAADRGNTDNIKYRNLQVDRDVPIHGRVLPLQQVLQDIQRMTKAAEDVCMRTSASVSFCRDAL